MSDLVFAAADAARPLVDLAADVPNPANGGKPLPGGAQDDLMTILGWVFKIVMILAVAGILGVAAKLVINFRRGEGGEHMGALGWVMGGCILAGGASGIVNTLL
ncbi:hypothetical protein [Streptomyces sp. NPDC047525]|uniref:hypothetical protein n=1 Tax=Streptomyces sp. NPDC047525 TaxID=3155264 RepID=UPI0033D52B36